MLRIVTIRNSLKKRGRSHNKFQCEEIVIGGDFNLTLNVELDKVGGRETNHTRSGLLS